MRILIGKVILLFSFFAFAGGVTLDSQNLLNKFDFHLVYGLALDGPALESALDDENQWESFNEWICFSQEKLNIQCAEYDDSVLVPSVFVENGDTTFEFDAHPEDGIDCDEAIQNWNALFEGSTQVCFMGAELPGVFEDSAHSLIYLRAIKTENGYWSTDKGE